MSLRAATAIVGAIAVSSILIALALILSAGDDSSPAKVTRTVTEWVEARPPKQQARQGSAARAGGLSECDGGEFTVEATSCEVGAKIHDQYLQGNRGELIAVGAHETITMTCEVSTPVTCSGPGGARVYFAP